MFNKNYATLFCHAHDSVFVGPNTLEIGEFIRNLRELKQNIEENGHIEDYIGVNFERKDDARISHRNLA